MSDCTLYNARVILLDRNEDGGIEITSNKISYIFL